MKLNKPTVVPVYYYTPIYYKELKEVIENNRYKSEEDYKQELDKFEEFVDKDNCRRINKGEKLTYSFIADVLITKIYEIRPAVVQGVVVRSTCKIVTQESESLCAISMESLIKLLGIEADRIKSETVYAGN